MWVDISADGVPEADRFEWFNAVVASELMPTALSTDRTDTFDAQVSALDLGALQVSKFLYSPLRSRRTPALIRRSDPEQYQLALVTSGSEWITQRDNGTALSAGDMVFWNSSYPWEAGVPDADGHVEAVVLQLPRSALPFRPERVDRILARRIPARTGMAAILGRFLTSLHAEGPDCAPQDLARLAGITTDLVAACLAEHLDLPAELPAEAHGRALRARIDRFVEHNLCDPELTPRAIAAQHAISLRTLYSLYEDEDGYGYGQAGRGGIATVIRRLRLARAHEDLADPELSRHTIQSIAARRGFTSATAFSRAFREEYGVTPTQHRGESLADPAARNVAPSRTPRTPHPPAPA
ncbi:helix-turn-helix domain-containing protein [Streptomyces sp. NPDC012888]|uniref:AraC-like ligand-binding domain-containing protein n=1 Tax=Streptomyces sp. NPDC012888 TaxID=3364855 RepID=UPI0036C906B3